MRLLVAKLVFLILLPQNSCWYIVVESHIIEAFRIICLHCCFSKCKIIIVYLYVHMCTFLGYFIAYVLAHQRWWCFHDPAHAWDLIKHFIAHVLVQATLLSIDTVQGTGTTHESYWSAGAAHYQRVVTTTSSGTQASVEVNSFISKNRLSNSRNHWNMTKLNFSRGAAVIAPSPRLWLSPKIRHSCTVRAVSLPDSVTEVWYIFEFYLMYFF